MAKCDIGGTGQKTPVLQMKQFLNDPLAKRYVLLQKYCWIIDRNTIFELTYYK